MKQVLALSITPKKSIIRINGKEFKLFNGEFIQLMEVGKYEVDISAVNYEPQKIEVDISADKATKIDVKLKENFNTLSVTSTPIEAEVWINGTRKGSTPYNVSELDSGIYSIELRKEEYKIVKKEISLGKGEHVDLNFNLEELPGNIFVNVLPSHSKVYIDNKNMGETPIIIHNLKRGNHQLKITAPEGSELEEVVNIKGGATLDYSKDIPKAILREYSDCRIGDIFYSDGSFSHELNPNKHPVGVVFSLKTTEEEQARGWSHGQIVALRDHCESVSWSHGNPSISGFQLYHFLVNCFEGHKKSRGDGLLDKNGLLHTIRAKADQPGTRPAFDACMNYQPKKKLFEKREKAEKYAQLPPGATSGWYLPSAGQWADIIENIGHTSFKFSLDGGFFCIDGISIVKNVLNMSSKCYWTSTLKDCNQSWVCNIGHFGIDFESKNNTDTYAIRPVAAF